MSASSDRRWRQVLAAMREGRASAPEIGRRIGTTPEAVRKYLHTLRVRGFVERHGTVPGIWGNKVALWSIRGANR
jgi:predicted ArsR family transcriptional regulator